MSVSFPTCSASHRIYYILENNSRLVALHLSSDKSTGEEGDYKEKNKTFQRTLTALSASGCLEDYSTLRAVLKDNFYVGVFTQIRSVVLTVKKTTRNEWAHFRSCLHACTVCDGHAGLPAFTTRMALKVCTGVQHTSVVTGYPACGSLMDVTMYMWDSFKNRSWTAIFITGTQLLQISLHVLSHTSVPLCDCTSTSYPTHLLSPQGQREFLKQHRMVLNWNLTLITESVGHS